MTTQARVVGFVVGKDTIKGFEVWKVRSNEGTKFQVASTHENIVLAPGLSVSFLIGTFKEGEQSVRKAVDVMILSETQEELEIKVRPSDYDSLSLVVIEDEDGSRYVWITGHENEQDAQAWGEAFGKLIGFAHFDINNFSNGVFLDFEEAKNGFRAINAISNLDGVVRALEELLTMAYNLGQKSQ